jgi:hypothetical protein
MTAYCENCQRQVSVSDGMCTTCGMAVPMPAPSDPAGDGYQGS